VRRIVAGASADPDAGHSACARGLPVKFQARARGFPWAWDEEAVAGAAHWPTRQDVRLGVACRAAVDAIAEAVPHCRGVRPAVVHEGGPEHDRGAKAVVVQDAGQREPRGLKAKPGVPPRGQASQVALAQWVLLREPQVGQELQLPEAAQARVSPPQVRVHDARRVEVPGLGLPVSRPPVGGRGQEEQQQAPPLEQGADVKLPSRPLLWRRARLPRCFPRLPHP
jgi:hypothetical protein